MQDYRPVVLFVFSLLSLLAERAPALADRIFTLCETDSGYTAPNHALLREHLALQLAHKLTRNSEQRRLEPRPGRHTMHDRTCAHL
jgi:hypothetical protein